MYRLGSEFRPLKKGAGVVDVFRLREAAKAPAGKERHCLTFAEQVPWVEAPYA
jgi:hypothetical protein